MQIDGISAVVTGGGSGLGRATTAALMTQGADVVIVDLPSSPGADTATELGARFVPADVTDTDAVNAALDAAEETGPIRALVHCAGRGGDRMRIIGRDRTPSPLESFRQVLDVNLVGTYNVLRLVSSRMAGNDVVDGDRGAIVLTASVAAFDGQIGQTSYTALQGKVVDRCLQLFGGYCYVTEYPIARLYADARVTRIYGGTSEVMKSIISKSLGL